MVVVEAKLVENLEKGRTDADCSCDHVRIEFVWVAFAPKFAAPWYQEIS